MAENDFNRNDKQQHFNQIKGVVSEINDHEKFPSITLKVGHENVREVNLCAKKHLFDKMISNVSLNDKISVRFYVTSRKKNDKWFTSATILSIVKED